MRCAWWKSSSEVEELPIFGLGGGLVDWNKMGSWSKTASCLHYFLEEQEIWKFNSSESFSNLSFIRKSNNPKSSNITNDNYCFRITMLQREQRHSVAKVQRFFQLLELFYLFPPHRVMALMGDTTMFLPPSPPIAQCGGLLPHFLCLKLRVKTIF